MERHGARFPRLFRPPYGMWNATTLALLRRYRMLMVLWTVDTNDYRRPGVQAIVKTALAGAVRARSSCSTTRRDRSRPSRRSRSSPACAAALPLVTVPRLLLDNPAPRVQNIASVIGSGG